MKPSEVFPLDIWALIANKLDYDDYYYLAKTCKQMHSHLMKGFSEPIYINQETIKLDRLNVWWIERPGTYILTGDIYCNKVRIRSRKGYVVLDGQNKWGFYFNLTYEPFTEERDERSYIWKGDYIDDPSVGFIPNGVKCRLSELFFEVNHAPDWDYSVANLYPRYNMYRISGRSPFLTEEENVKKLKDEEDNNYASIEVTGVSFNG